ncbi:putative nf-x1-type zinc finger protein nfxl1 protein [Botrytis fragariae]|uniref:Putative nf-x1-type zinc finger protein nfxl1 protein n=1 Tax=Botrytis fragariae TaxID=1964551 RepID=A0A8H6B2T0_9HELO|nr:putative nf-x1-type zinc finger protein nfxl1 protein [Botrytis fragariae]KAF5878366.1 putative nf-x1-type zinc finger protein nfxl1 protein [Botrytis fragariae]
MATTESSPASGSNRPPRTRTRRPRRGGHRDTGPAPADGNTNATPNLTTQVPNGPLALRPASVAPLPDSNSPAPSNPRNSNANNRGGGNGRRGGFGRGGRRGGGRGQPMANGRVFGGQLTSNSHTGPTSDAGSLAGDAPAFTPGHPIATRPGPSRAPRARRMSKSQAADLATRTHEDITNGQYECAICTNEVLPNSKIWNCKSCWSVLHLSCVKKWSKNEVSTHQQRAVENGELPPPRQWRCPGCNLPKEDLPISYTCWCEKEIEPRSVAGLPPHSCGRVVQKNGSDIVLIHVILCAMLDSVHLALTWGLHFLAFVAKRRFQEDV